MRRVVLDSVTVRAGKYAVAKPSFSMMRGGAEADLRTGRRGGRVDRPRSHGAAANPMLGEVLLVVLLGAIEGPAGDISVTIAAWKLPVRLASAFDLSAPPLPVPGGRRRSPSDTGRRDQGPWRLSCVGIVHGEEGLDQLLVGDALGRTRLSRPRRAPSGVSRPARSSGSGVTTRVADLGVHAPSSSRKRSSTPQKQPAAKVAVSMMMPAFLTFQCACARAHHGLIPFSGGLYTRQAVKQRGRRRSACFIINHSPTDEPPSVRPRPRPGKLAAGISRVRACASRRLEVSHIAHRLPNLLSSVALRGPFVPPWSVTRLRMRCGLAANVTG